LQITPTKETDIALVPTEQDTRSVNALDIFTQTALATSTDTPQKNDDTIFAKVNCNILLHGPALSYCLLLIREF